MVGFFIKKAFFDGWDNLYALAALNIVYIVILIIFFALPGVLGAPLWLLVGVAIVGVFIFSFWEVIVAGAMERVSDGQNIHRADIKKFIPYSLKLGSLLGGINLLYAIAFAVAIPFYLEQQAVWSIFASGVLFWTMIAGMLILQYVPSLFAHDKSSARDAFRTALYLFIDNPGFSIFLFLWRTITLAISALTMLLAPGFAGVTLASIDAVKLRRKKYPYLKEHPEANRRHIPWNDILIEDKELVGKRTLRNMIFPWKD